MSDQQPTQNPALAAALPELPAGRFWRIAPVYDTRNFWKTAPNLLDHIRNSLPSLNPDKLRLELRAELDVVEIVPLNLSRVIASEVLEIDGMPEADVIEHLATAAKRLLRNTATAETGRTRASTFTGDYR